MIVTRDNLALALAELEAAARTYQQVSTHVPQPGPLGQPNAPAIALQVVAIADADVRLTSAIGEAQAMLRKLEKDNADRAALAQFTAVGEGASRER